MNLTKVKRALKLMNSDTPEFLLPFSWQNKTIYIMNKFLFIIGFLFLFSSPVRSQFEVGIKAGLNSTDLASQGILVNQDDGTGIMLNFKDSEYGYQFGLYTRISALGIYLEPSFLFNSSKVNYTIEDPGSGLDDIILSETYNNLDIPIMLGIKFGPLRLQGGAVAHIFIDSASELVSLSGYEQNFKEGTYGWQAGIGLDLWKFRLELNYEGNLENFGEHIVIDGQPYQFDNSASRLILNAGIRF